MPLSLVGALLTAVRASLWSQRYETVTAAGVDESVTAI